MRYEILTFRIKHIRICRGINSSFIGLKGEAMNRLFDEFRIICLQLNEVGIVPTLMGSLGLEYMSKEDWSPADIDIHVPGNPRGWEAPDELRIYDWDKIKSVMEDLGYQLTDAHEHEFKNNDFCVQYGAIDSLYDFAGIHESDIDIAPFDNIRFRVPSLDQFLKIYTASSKDSYRNDRNNNKDFKKRNIHVRVLDMPLLNTENKDDLTANLINDVVLELLSYVAESERKNTKQRQKEGIKAAKDKGVKFGRPSVELPDNWNSVIKDWKAGKITAKQAMDLTGMKRTSFYKVVKSQ